MSSEILPVEAEQVLDACSEKACQLQCQWQGRGVALGLDGIDRLPRDTQCFGELALGQAAVLAQVAHPVLHPVKLTCQAGYLSSSLYMLSRDERPSERAGLD